MGDDIGSGLSSMITICFDFHSTNVVHTIGLGQSSMTTICFDFHSTNVVQLSNRNPFFYRFWGHHPLITRLILHPLGILTFGKNISNLELNIRKCILVFINFWRLLDLQACLLENQPVFYLPWCLCVENCFSVFVVLGIYNFSVYVDEHSKSVGCVYM